PSDDACRLVPELEDGREAAGRFRRLRLLCHITTDGGAADDHENVNRDAHRQQRRVPVRRVDERDETHDGENRPRQDVASSVSPEKRKRVREDSEKGLEVPREADPEEKRRGSGRAFVQFVFEKIFERDQSDGVLLAESDRRDPDKYDQRREEKIALMPRG